MAVDAVPWVSIHIFQLPDGLHPLKKLNSIVLLPVTRILYTVPSGACIYKMKGSLPAFARIFKIIEVVSGFPVIEPDEIVTMPDELPLPNLV